MNSLHALDYAYYKSRLELFTPGMAEHITPIRFEVITPDMSLLSFRTSGKDGTEYYFALLQYDYMFSIKHATKVISAQFATVIEYAPPVTKQKGRTELEQKSVTFPKQGYHILLARTERPSGKGYWASYIKIMPGNNIAQELKPLGDKDKSAAQTLIQEILQKNPPTNNQSNTNDFLDAWKTKQNRWQSTINDVETNDTDLEIHIFKNAIGNWEGFYNYIDRSAPSKKVV